MTAPRTVLVAEPPADDDGTGDGTGDGASARIFNSAVAGYAVAAAWELGALDELHERGAVDVDEFCRRRDLHRPSVTAVVAALAAVDVVRRDGALVRPGPAFAGVHRDKAFFHWLTAGCGELFAALPAIARNAHRVGEFYRRDHAAIARSCREINRLGFDPVFTRVLDGLGDVARVADLGCGSGERLAQLAGRWPGLTGVGVDSSPAALREAELELATRGLAERFDLVAGDVRAMSFDARFAGVELLTCFMMGHDFWPRERCRATLRRLRTVFPDARRFLLGDTARTAPGARPPVFTLGFETAHDVMGVDLPTLEDWHGVFAGSGWRLVRAHPVAVPRESVVFELA